MLSFHLSCLPLLLALAFYWSRMSEAILGHLGRCEFLANVLTKGLFVTSTTQTLPILMAEIAVLMFFFFFFFFVYSVASTCGQQWLNTVFSYHSNFKSKWPNFSFFFKSTLEMGQSVAEIAVLMFFFFIRLQASSRISVQNRVVYNEVWV